MREEPHRAARWILRLGALVVIAPCALYFVAYAYVRSTHRLVHYGGGFIARPNVYSGWNHSPEEIVFVPAIVAERIARGIVDPSF